VEETGNRQFSQLSDIRDLYSGSGSRSYGCATLEYYPCFCKIGKTMWDICTYGRTDGQTPRLT